MKKILLVEDDDYFRIALKDILSKTYEVVEAHNGKVAREILFTLDDVSLIISDIQMPHFTGVELLEWVKKNKPVPFILMTGFAHILEIKMAHELGADDFLPKPFKQKELMDKIAKLLGEDKKKEIIEIPDDLDKDFRQIPIEDFIAEKEMDYSIYIRISKIKYIKIAHKGGKLPEDKIQAFREKSISHLYVRQEDFAKLVGFTLLASKVISQSSQIESVKKIRFMQYTGDMIMQQIHVAGTDEALFNNAKDFLMTSLGVLTEEEETFTLLNLLSNHTDYLYGHSLGVSIFSVMIAKQMGWHSEQTLLKLSFAVFSMMLARKKSHLKF